jgi:hypothetical protein|tara:strand:+ start:1662 stop:2207 length:546 start_codon:yes stop_codon:yes gene_type:complete
MEITEAIVELKNIIDPSFCERIIPLIDKKATKHLTVRGGLDTNIRRVKGYSLDFTTPTNLFYWNFVKQEINRLYFHYKYKFPLMMSNKINQIDLLKYKRGGNYQVHTDHFTTSPRVLSIIMNLNSDYEGGDLVFTDQKEKEIKRCKLEKGSMLFFPSNFLFPHTVKPITKGTRYNIVAWLQ